MASTSSLPPFEIALLPSLMLENMRDERGFLWCNLHSVGAMRRKLGAAQDEQGSDVTKVVNQHISLLAGICDECRFEGCTMKHWTPGPIRR